MKEPTMDELVDTFFKYRDPINGLDLKIDHTFCPKCGDEDTSHDFFNYERKTSLRTCRKCGPYRVYWSLSVTRVEVL